MGIQQNAPYTYGNLLFVVCDGLVHKIGLANFWLLVVFGSIWCCFWCQNGFLSSDFRLGEFMFFFCDFAFLGDVWIFGRGVGIFDAHSWIRLEISLRLLATRPQTDGSRPHSRTVCDLLWNKLKSWRGTPPSLFWTADTKGNSPYITVKKTKWQIMIYNSKGNRMANHDNWQNRIAKTTTNSN